MNLGILVNPMVELLSVTTLIFAIGSTIYSIHYFLKNFMIFVSSKHDLLESPNKMAIAEALANEYGIDPPKRKKGDGSTITRDWLAYLHRVALNKNPSGTKNEIVSSMAKTDLTDFNSAGSTVTGESLAFVYRRLRRRRFVFLVFSASIAILSWLSML